MSYDTCKYEMNNNEEELSIDFQKIISNIWNKRFFILKVTGTFIIFGLFIALSTPNEYTASCTLVPQTGEKKAGGSLSGLAAMAGISLGSNASGEILSPAVYPNIISNINFQKELIYSEYFIEDSQKKFSYYEIITNNLLEKFNLLSTLKKYTIGLPGLALSLFTKKDKHQYADKQIDNFIIELITNIESDVIKDLYSNLSLHMNDQLGYFTIEAKSNNPKIAAQIVLNTQNLLQKYLTEFKLEKVRSNLTFIEKSYSEAKENFEIKQKELANFRDSNKGLTSSIYITHEEKLISEYNLLLGIYSELAKQKEEAKIAVTENTPLLTVIQPVVVPTEKSGPKKLFTLIGFTFFGIFVSIGFVFVYPEIKKIIQKI